MKQSYTATVSKEGRWFVAQCLEIDLASQGRTEAQALRNLKEAIELHLEPPAAVAKPKIRRLEIKRRVA